MFSDVLHHVDLLGLGGVSPVDDDPGRSELFDHCRFVVRGAEEDEDSQCRYLVEQLGNEIGRTVIDEAIDVVSNDLPDLRLDLVNALGVKASPNTLR